MTRVYDENFFNPDGDFPPPLPFPFPIPGPPQNCSKDGCCCIEGIPYRDKYGNCQCEIRSDEELLGEANRSGGQSFGFIPALIGAAPGIFSTVMGLFNKRKAQYQGLAEINAAGSQAVQAMQQILAGLQSGQMSPQQAVSEAQRIVQQFNDPSVVYPAKKGNDAAARNNFIQQLNQLLQQVQTAAAQVTQASRAAGIDPATGRPIPGGSGDGISSTTLLLVGGGLLGVYLLTSQNQNQYQYPR